MDMHFSFAKCEAGWRTHRSWLALLACGLALAGCHHAQPLSKEAEIQSSLNRFYAAEPACLWSAPITLEPTEAAAPAQAQAKANELRALDEAGVLDKARHGYLVTAAGRPFWRADPKQPGFGNVCYGHWRVSRVDRTTPHQDDLFGATVEASFEASIPSPALWTRMPAVQKAFPLMALKLSRSLPHGATMKHTGKGWQVAAIEVP